LTGHFVRTGKMCQFLSLFVGGDIIVEEVCLRRVKTFPNDFFGVFHFGIERIVGREKAPYTKEK
jgi:hypothetical protein